MHLATRVILVLFFLILSTSLTLDAQSPEKGEVHGNIYSIIQFYNNDTIIGTTDVPEKLLSNTYADLNYRLGGFTAGIRFEAYLNPLLGYDPRYKGTGFPYKYINYTYKNLSITAGNFYEQFGSGLVLRSYEDKDLGYDNSINGLRVRYEPVKGISLKGVIGKQRNYWTTGEGIIRGLDAELNINEILESGFHRQVKEGMPQVIIGSSVVSKYTEDNNSAYRLPENVAAFSERLVLSYRRIHLEAEYVYKYNDPYPSIYHEYNYIYKPGQALLVTGSYSKKGLGINLLGKRIDNMNFRSYINAKGNDLMINYLPPLTLQHEYILQNFFPYATQANGEMGMQGQFVYKFRKGTILGGSYGTEVMINYSRIQSIQRSILADSTHLGYESEFFKTGDEVYYEDAGIEINKKINKKTKLVLSFTNFTYNNRVVKGFDWNGSIFGNAAVADITYKLTDNKALRMELQHLYTRQYKRNWALCLVEYSVSPLWSFTAYDEYNYNNPETSKRLHYYTGGLRYNKDGKSIQLMYGRRVEGVTCIGGICRYMPSSNGLTAIISCTF